MYGRHGNTEKALRITSFPPPGVGGPVTNVTLVSDLKVSPEQMAAIFTQGGYFAAIDIFDVPISTSAVSAGILGAQRAWASATDEGRMAVAYYHWTRGFDQISERGLILSGRPAPLTTEQLAEVLRQIALHPDYVAQTIQALDRDGVSVRLEDGRVVCGGPPVGPRGHGGSAPN